MVVFSVGKNSDGIIGLMGTTEAKNKPVKVDKATKVMFCLILLFLISSFVFSLVISNQYESIVK